MWSGRMLPDVRRAEKARKPQKAFSQTQILFFWVHTCISPYFQNSAFVAPRMVCHSY
jgi:hypothetical protein